MKHIFFFIFLFLGIKCFSQKHTYITGDTIVLRSSNGSTLQILNPTKDTIGVLWNYGNGVTGFKSVNSSIANAWNLTGNIGTDTLLNWIGTNDGHNLIFKVNGVRSGIIDYTSNLNTSFGHQTLLANTSGSNNAAFGKSALKNNTTGSNNVAAGGSPLLNNTSGSNNTAFGTSALFHNTSGGGNFAVGLNSGFNNTSGSNNINIGGTAGFNNLGSNNVLIGNGAMITYNLSNSGNIAHTIYWTNNNGHDSVAGTTNLLAIGNTSPVSMFNVGTASQFQVNSTGDVVKLNSVTTSFPSSQGAASTVLTNNGSGTLSWSATASDPTKTDTSKTTQSANYVIKKISTTYYAIPRIASGLPLISSSDAYTVIQGAINNLTVAGASGTSGGKIYITSGSYPLTDQLTIIGWESGGVPYSSLVIQGDGFSTHISQSTSGKYGILIKNGAAVFLNDFSISRSGSAKSCIYGDSTGATSEFSFYKGGMYNILAYGSSTATPTVQLNNIGLCVFEWLDIENTTGNALVINNASASSLYGNSSFNYVALYASPTYPYANLKITSTTTNVWSNLMTFNNVSSTHGYYGIYTDYASNCTFNFVDLEGLAIPIALGMAGGNTQGMTFNSGYVFPLTGDTAISLGAVTAGNAFMNMTIEASSSNMYPVVDLSNFARSNYYDNMILRNAGSAANITITNPSTRFSYVTNSTSGTSLTAIPALNIPLNARLADFPRTGIILADSIADRLMLRTASKKTATLSLISITANTSILDSIQNKSGTLALTSNINDSLAANAFVLRNSKSGSGDSLLLVLSSNVGVVKRVAYTSPLVSTSTSDSLRTISIPAATSSVNGYLTSTDWTTFNAKASLSGNNTFTGTTNTFAPSSGTVALNITGHLVPTSNNAYDIGSSDAIIRQGYFAGADIPELHASYHYANVGDHITFIQNNGSTKIARFSGDDGEVIFQSGGTYTANHLAQVSINSTTKGFLPPRMSSTERNAIAVDNTAKGLIVFDTTLHKLIIYNSSTWAPVIMSNYISKTANYTATSLDYFIDCLTNTFTVTLPTAVGIQGTIYVIKNSTASTTITIATTSSQTIDGAATKTINTQYAGYELISDNANWKVKAVF